MFKCFCFSTYEGDVVDGMRHGVGILHSVSLGVTYSGDWVSGKQHGKVRVHCASYLPTCLTGLYRLASFKRFPTRQVAVE